MGLSAYLERGTIQPGADGQGSRTHAVGFWLGLALVVVFCRLAHSGIVWIEEAYPSAAVLQVLHGKALYRDIWFDKPPLSAWLYLLWQARLGVVLRLVGAGYVVLCASLAYHVARTRWSAREGYAAAVFCSLYLTFGVPSAVLALAPDLLLVAPHIAAIGLLWAGLPWYSGLAVGLGLAIHTKGALVAVMALLWMRGCHLRCWLSGFSAASAAVLLVLLAQGSLGSYWEQVWRYGMAYAADPLYAHPWREGWLRTLRWAGMHAALLVAAAWGWRHEPAALRLRWATWLALGLAGVWLGERFFPRYYFLLLPPLVLLAASGYGRAGRRLRALIFMLALIPVVRYGPRYVQLAQDAWQQREPHWSDLALYQDSARIAEAIRQRQQPGDTLLVWGYRPDVFALTRLPAATPFLDSQPLTGVLADRHLSQNQPTTPGLAATQRQRIAALRPTFLVDGLGPMQPALAPGRYPEMQAMLPEYRLIAQTPTALLYQHKRRSQPASY